jgi:hypothetical protein
MIQPDPPPPYRTVLRLLDRQLTAIELADLVDRLRDDQLARRQAAALLLQIGVLQEMARERDDVPRAWWPRSPRAQPQRSFALVALCAGLAAAIALVVVGLRRPPSPPGAHRTPAAARLVAHRSPPRPIAVPAGHRALLVRGGEPEPWPADALLAGRLEAMGFEVVQLLDAELAALDVHGADLVVISASAEGRVIRERLLVAGLRTSGVPVVSCEGATFDLLGMTGPRSWDGSAARGGFGSAPDHTGVEIAAPDHPLAAGLHGPVAVATAPVALTWGEPSRDAIRVATLDTNRALVAQFAYERGAAMSGLRAPARRVGCFISADAARLLTTDGWALFEAAVRWAIEP